MSRTVLRAAIALSLGVALLGGLGASGASAGALCGSGSNAFCAYGETNFNQPRLIRSTETTIGYRSNIANNDVESYKNYTVRRWCAYDGDSSVQQGAPAFTQDNYAPSKRNIFDYYIVRSMSVTC
jgi:Peptidase inhibitor family I36